MRTMLRACLSLALLAILAGPVAAQGPGRGFGRFGNLGMLLGNASVQKELKLDDKQIEKAKELAEKTGEKMRENFEAVRDLEADERRTKMTELNRELTASTIKSAGEFLKPEQVTRLKQISYQQRGRKPSAIPRSRRS